MSVETGTDEAFAVDASAQIGSQRPQIPLFLFGSAIFLGAFLLFLVQPLIARYILPWFGGAASVWTVTLLFFQVGLLAGYGYAHFIVSRLRIRSQVALHIGLAAAALLVLPIIPSEALKPAGSSSPTIDILLLLAVTVGLPYVVLSATGPLMQAWLTLASPGRSPYRLYALSNVGSLLGLLSYPFLVERYLSLRHQAWLWSGGFIAYAVVTAIIGRRIYASTSTENEVDASAGEAEMPQVEPDDARVSVRTRVMWLSLPGAAVVILLAVTNQMTLEVAQIPLLWVLPLTMYLLSFIIVFARPAIYRRGLFGVLLAISMALVVRTLVNDIGSLPTQVAVYSLGVFSITMSLHGELVRLTPPTRHLTDFYLMIATGGALGGVAVALVAPRAFPGLWELHLGLVATVGLVGVSWISDARSRESSSDEALPAASKARALFDGLVMFAAWAALLAGSVLMIRLLIEDVRTEADDVLAVERSFFGVLRVVHEYPDDPDAHLLSLLHGPIEHGFQYVNGDRVDWPTSYYSPKSGAGIVITELRGQPGSRGEAANRLSVGVVGLGTGTMAAWAAAGDSYVFYEIDPGVVDLSDRYFTYLSRAEERGASVDVLVGDARLVMERQLEGGDAPQFDLLVLDAFSGDAIPVHLLTREAFEIYSELLTPDGIVVVHTSNLHLDLTPVVRGLAQANGKEAVLIESRADDSIGAFSADWIIVTSNHGILESDAISRWSTEWEVDDRSPLLWTDDHSNILGILD